MTTCFSNPCLPVAPRDIYRYSPPTMVYTDTFRRFDLAPEAPGNGISSIHFPTKLEIAVRCYRHGPGPHRGIRLEAGMLQVLPVDIFEFGVHGSLGVLSQWFLRCPLESIVSLGVSAPSGGLSRGACSTPVTLPYEHTHLNMG